MYIYLQFSLAIKLTGVNPYIAVVCTILNSYTIASGSTIKTTQVSDYYYADNTALWVYIGDQLSNLNSFSAYTGSNIFMRNIDKYNCGYARTGFLYTMISTTNITRYPWNIDGSIGGGVLSATVAIQTNKFLILCLNNG